MGQGVASSLSPCLQREDHLCDDGLQLAAGIGAESRRAASRWGRRSCAAAVAPLLRLLLAVATRRLLRLWPLLLGGRRGAVAAGRLLRWVAALGTARRLAICPLRRW